MITTTIENNLGVCICETLNTSTGITSKHGKISTNPITVIIFGTRMDSS
jgi:hypothetical protein